MSLLRYDLDKLGWLEFERLVQALLKEKLGVGIEAWGGRSDAGRDAYHDGSLVYPGNRLERGPFVFQVKFIEGANAAGAKPSGILRAAVSAEARRVLQRQARVSDQTRHYVLFTNANASIPDRAFISKTMSEALPSAAVHVHGGIDVCAWLDGAPNLLQTYPQIAGLTQLVSLLERVAGAEIVTRSMAAIREAEALAKVFVPTQCFDRARALLEEHAFVVVVGPPEVGKTAIGRMLALSGVARGWHAIECVWPGEVHEAFNADQSQIFLADDFFGRSEYDTQMGSAWLRELPRVLSLVDARHHLVFTTRRHLLAMLKDDLDLSGRARRFPQPSELIVDAGELSRIEKGKILYRHAKLNIRDKAIREFVRSVATSLVDDAHFTPERIRRLVEDQSLRVDRAIEPSRSRDLARQLAREALARPTDGMRTTFRRLPRAHRWMLYALAETESSGRRQLALGNKDLLRRGYLRLCPNEVVEPFDDVMFAINHTFVIDGTSDSVRWVHPSARDLVIAELKRDNRDRLRFLRHANAQGLALATSVAGYEGTEHFPLLQSDDDWEALRERMQMLATTTPLDLELVMSNELVAARIGGELMESQKRLRRILVESLWPVIIERLNASDAWTGAMLCHCARHLDRQPATSLVLDGFGRRELERVRRIIRDSNLVFWQRDFGVNEDWDSLRAVVSLVGSLAGLESYINAIVDEVLDALSEELDASYDDGDLTLNDHAEYVSQCESLIESLSTVDKLVGRYVGTRRRRRIASVSDRLDEARTGHVEPERWNHKPERSSVHRQESEKDDVSIEDLFADL